MHNTNRNAHLVRRYVDERVGQGDFSTDTAAQVTRVLKQWLRHAGPVPARWSEADVRSFVHVDRHRPAYRKSRLTKVRPFVQWLVDEGTLPRDITRKMARIRIPSGAPRDLTVDEVRELVDACTDQRALLVVVVMLQLGLRSE